MLGVGAFVLAWFQTGPRTRTTALSAWSPHRSR